MIHCCLSDVLLLLHRWICCFKKISHVQPALVGTDMPSEPLLKHTATFRSSREQKCNLNLEMTLVLPTLLLIQHCYLCIVSFGGAMATNPEKRKASLSVHNTLFWRRHANVLFLRRESIKGKPVTVCKCYANAYTGKHCKCVGVFKGENTFTPLMETVNGPYFPQEPTDLLTFKHACLHTWTSAPRAAGIKSHQLACSSWFIWEIEQTPEGKFEFRRASLYVWPGQN